MHKELDKFVETDERVRSELDRKGRVEYLKEKNQEEFQRSFIKVKTSQSPPKKRVPEITWSSPSYAKYGKKPR